MYRFVRLGFVLSLTITLLIACGGAPSSVTPPSGGTPAPPPVAELSAERLALAENMQVEVNALRTSGFICTTGAVEAGSDLDPLGLNNRLIWAAIVHSEDMAKHDLRGHTGSAGDDLRDRVDGQGYDWSTIAENVASGQNGVEEVMIAWRDSLGHCNNIMEAGFTEMGAAVTENEETGRTYWVQVFAAPR